MNANMEPRVIHSNEEYERALSELERLMDTNPSSDSEDGARLELLSVLVDDYESKNFPLPDPTPVEAIRFRMEQQGLSPRDLEPFIGSRSKVSEVLSGKIPLSIRMVRELSSGLGIPADVLIQPTPSKEESRALPERMPIREILRLGWIDMKAGETLADVATRFLDPIGGQQTLAPLWRVGKAPKSGQRRKSRADGALMAWVARVLTIAGDVASENAVPTRITLSDSVISSALKLSVSPQGPIEVCRYLLAHGVVVVAVPHLAGTHLDGGAVRSPEGYCAIGLTLRHDRLDSFWFTLMHELAHAARHLGGPAGVYLDDLDAPSSKDPQEIEADTLASEWLIPSQIWKRSAAYRQRSVESVLRLADELSIHPSIVAGRLRRDTHNFHIMTSLVGHRQVRRLFPSFKTEEGD